MNHARRDLCGGCPVMGIPTAIGGVVSPNQGEGPQRGSGRRIPPLVSKIQVATTNAGARAQGGLTPDFLALSWKDAIALVGVLRIWDYELRRCALSGVMKRFRQFGGAEHVRHALEVV